MNKTAASLLALVILNWSPLAFADNVSVSCKATSRYGQTAEKNFDVSLLPHEQVLATEIDGFKIYTSVGGTFGQLGDSLGIIAIDENETMTIATGTLSADHSVSLSVYNSNHAQRTELFVNCELAK